MDENKEIKEPTVTENGKTDGASEIHKDKASDSPLADKVAAFGKFYLFLVIICGVILCGAIALAVYVHVAVGIAVGVVAVVLYRCALDDTLKKTFGLAYKRVEGGIAVAPIKKDRGECPQALYVPERLMWLDVVGLYGAEKKAERGYAEIYLPATVKIIEEDCLASFDRLEAVYFNGERAAWEQIEGGSGLFVICKGEEVGAAEKCEENGKTDSQTEE